jgi:hypothetical protein
LAPFGVVAFWVALSATAAPPALPQTVTSLQMREPVEASAEAPPDAPLRAKLQPLPPEPLMQRPHYALATVETAGFLTLGTYWYWRNSDFNARDWDLIWNWDSWEKKGDFSVVRFDDNTFDTNAFWHPLDGAGLWLVARGNRLSPFKSLVLVTLSSIVWEYVVEFREYPSANDMIMTPLASAAVAEPAIRLAALLRAGNRGPISEALAAVLDPVGAINGMFEGRSARSQGGTDANGLPIEYRHRLEIFGGVGQTTFGGQREHTETRAGLDLFIDATPGAARPGRQRGLVGMGTLTYLRGGVAVDGEKLSGANVEGKLALAGVMWRDYEDAAIPRGHTLFLGAGSGFDYLKRASPLLADDRQANVRVAGPMVDWALARGLFTLHVAGDATYDFAQVTPLAGDEFLANYAALGGYPTVVSRERYYYAQGLSLRARAIGTIGRWQSGIDFDRDDFWPLGGLDRHGAPAVPGTMDSRSRRRAWVGVKPWANLPFMASVNGAQTTSEGRMGGVNVETSEWRASTLLSLIF